MELKDKVAIVTGASSGIGAATAKCLADAGAKVTLVARREGRLRELGIKDALICPGDVTSRAAMQEVADKTKSHFGRIDVLVNNAGLMPLSFMKNLHLDEWERMVDVNIKGVLWGIAAVLPTMREQKSGHIVNVSSVAGRKVFPSASVYCGTKFAVSAISEGMRMELSNEGIRSTVIEPGIVETELRETITDDEVKPFFKGLDKMRQLQSEDIAKSVLYAVSQPDHVNVAEILVMPSDQN